MKKKIGVIVFVFLFIIGISICSKATNDTKKIKQIENSFYDVQTNPLYPEISNKNKLSIKRKAEQKKDSENNINPNDNEEYYIEDITTLAKQIRDNEVKRKESFIVYAKFDATEEDMNNGFLGTYLTNLMEKAFSEDISESSSDGDYLKWSWYTRGIDESPTFVMEGNEIDTFYININFSYEYYTTFEQEQILDKEVEKFITLHIDKDDTRFEKLCKIYDYITKNIRYDNENLNDEDYLLKYTAYAAMNNKTAVCQGYATLMYKMLKESGENGIRIITFKNSSGSGHAWNAVKMGEYYYDIDSTWDENIDSNGLSSWRYFLKGTNYFNTLPSHTMQEEYLSSEFTSKYPLSTSDYVINEEYTSNNFLINLNDTEISPIEENYTYTSNDILPEVTLKYNDYDLVKGIDYNIEYSSNRKVGKATIEIQGLGYFTGKVKKNFNIIHTALNGTHNWNEGVITTPATCKDEGIKTYTCIECDEKRTEKIAKTENHNWNEGVITTPATCKDEGIKTYTCSMCGKTKTEDISIKAHNWNNGEITKNATCTEEGEKIYTCASGGEKRIEKISTTGHNWDNGKITKPATYSEEGIKTYTCKKCNATKTEKIAKTKIKNIENFVVSGISNKTYTGNEITQNITLKDGNTILQEGRDYTVGYTNNKNIGNAVITITGKEGYTGLINKTFKINPTSINQVTVLGIEDKKYTGSNIIQNITIKNGNIVLKYGVDYALSYKNNKDVGTATITITGKENYTGIINKTFKINAKSISQMIVEGIGNKTYTGGALVQNITLKDGNVALKNGTDYIIRYKNNKNVGTATITITGKGNYTGTINKTFKIKSKSISKLNIAGIENKYYTGKSLKQNITIKDGNTTLKNGTDYKIVYLNNKNIGKAIITIIGKGNYTGIKTKTFKITLKGTSISKVENGKKQIKVTWNKQKTQTTGYQIQYSTNKKFKSGTKTITVSKNKITSAIIKNLKANKKYYIRVRTYMKINNKLYYSDWSKAKNITNNK